MMSFAGLERQHRLKEADGGTLITLHHWRSDCSRTASRLHSQG
jgi:hypothetical protein